MSRTTTALKRLGVPSLAAITLVAGLPLFMGTAQAAHISNLELTPEADSAAVGVCNLFTVDIDPTTAGASLAGEEIDVVLTETDTDPATGGNQADTGNVQDVDFCTGTTGTQTGQAPRNATDSGAAGTTDRAEFITDEDGTAVFGIVGTAPGTVGVEAFYDANDNNVREATEPNDQAVKTFTAGGPAGSQQAANAVQCVDATPETDTNFVGEQHTIRVLLTNNAGTGGNNGVLVPDSGNTATGAQCVGDPVAGVTPVADITSSTGGNAAIDLVCTQSNNEGVAFCTYTGTSAGTDTITVFVEQTDGTGAGRQAAEPQDVVTKTYTANAQTGLRVNITCDDNAAVAGPTAGDNSAAAENCTNPTGAGDGTETFTAFVTDQAGAPQEGVVVRFTENGADATIVAANGTATGGGTNPTPDQGVGPADAQECVTGADGTCTAVLTERTPRNGEVITVTATIRGQNPAGDVAENSTAAGERSSDSGTKTFRNAATDARNIVLTPDVATTTAGQFQTFTARVTDVNGDPVQGVEVTFSETGAGAFRSGSSQERILTDANGIARVDVTSGATETGTQTVTATITTNNTQCGAAANTGATNSTARPTAGNCSDTSTNNFVAAQQQSPSATPTATTSPGQPTQAPGCTTADTARTRVITNTISAGARGIVEVDAPANSVVQLFAYSRPSTTFRLVRQAETSTGLVRFDNLTPPTNTRFQARVVKNGVGCAFGGSVVMNVRTTISLIAKRLGVRTYEFSGDSLPARPGGLIVSLYRVTNDGRQILTAQTRANASNGEYRIVRRFTGTGRFGFVVRTGQDLQNAPGSSNVRSLAVF